MTTRQPQHTSPEQLALLPVSELPLQFRLDQRTRQRGLAHIAAIRRQLAATKAPGRSTAAATATAAQTATNDGAVRNDQAA